tara:strand:+ start:192 stop:407 length:216 start_codon:yes stop_codon:yes gene_type:complete
MSATTNAVNSVALAIKAVDKINQVTGGRESIIEKSTTSGGGLAFPVNTRPTENNVLDPQSAGKRGSVDVTA